MTTMDQQMTLRPVHSWIGQIIKVRKITGVFEAITGRPL